MFPSRKPFRVRTRTTTKSSERKRSRALVQQSFQLSDDALEDIFPSKAPLEVAKLCCSCSPLDGRTEVDVLVYFVDREPLFFLYDNRVYPTVYSLWKCPEIVPSITTWPLVLPKMIGGADLMLPGVVRPEQDGADFAVLGKHQICAVNIAGNRSAVCVGVSLMSGTEMLASGMRGKGVVILHTYKDQLWEMGSRADPPVLSVVSVKPQSSASSSSELCTDTTNDRQTNILSASKPANEEPSIVQQHEEVDRGSLTVCQPSEKIDVSIENDRKLQSEGTDGSQVLDETVTERGSSTAQGPEVVLGSLPTPTSTHAEPTPLGAVALDEGEGPATVSQDDLMVHCFVMAVKHGGLHKDKLPMLTSAFFRTHMLTHCPQNCRLDVKKTKFKKLSVFLRTMTDSEVIEIKELTKGVDSIVSAQTKHPIIRKYSPSPALAQLLLEEQECLSSETQSSSSEKKEPGKILIVEMYMPSASSLPVFQLSGINKSSFLLPSQVREVLVEYIKREELQCTQDKRLVTLGPVLTDILHLKGAKDEERLGWSELMKKFMAVLRPAYKITLPNGDEFMRKGNPPVVKLIVSQRSGNKKATVVSNLEVYGINCDSLAAALKKMAAASTSVLDSAPEGKTVFVQGDATKLLIKLLTESYGLPSKSIEVVNKVKSKGK